MEILNLSPRETIETYIPKKGIFYLERGAWGQAFWVWHFIFDGSRLELLNYKQQVAKIQTSNPWEKLQTSSPQTLRKIQSRDHSKEELKRVDHLFSLQSISSLFTLLTMTFFGFHGMILYFALFKIDENGHISYQYHVLTPTSQYYWNGKWSLI